jgi:hypothetical protein
MCTSSTVRQRAARLWPVFFASYTASRYNTTSAYKRCIAQASTTRWQISYLAPRCINMVMSLSGV